MTKLILSALVLISGVQAHALLKDGSVSPYCRLPVGDSHYVDCLFTFMTTSFPLITIYGQTLDLNSPEASDRLAAEADGVVQPVILGKIAQDNDLDLEHVKAVAASLPDLTMANLMQALR